MSIIDHVVLGALNLLWSIRKYLPAAAAPSTCGNTLEDVLQLNSNPVRRCFAAFDIAQHWLFPHEMIVCPTPAPASVMSLVDGRVSVPFQVPLPAGTHTTAPAGA